MRISRTSKWRWLKKIRKFSPPVIWGFYKHFSVRTVYICFHLCGKYYPYYFSLCHLALILSYFVFRGLESFALPLAAPDMQALNFIGSGGSGSSIQSDSMCAGHQTSVQQVLEMLKKRQPVDAGKQFITCYKTSMLQTSGSARQSSREYQNLRKSSGHLWFTVYAPYLQWHSTHLRCKDLHGE